MARTFTFSIPDDDDDTIKTLEEWKKEFGWGGVARQIRLAMSKHRAEQTKGSKLTDYADKCERLDFFPDMNKDLTWGNFSRFTKDELPELRKFRRRQDNNNRLLNHCIYMLSGLRSDKDYQRITQYRAPTLTDHITEQNFAAVVKSEPEQTGPDISALPSANTPGFQDAMRQQGLTVRMIATMEPVQLANKYRFLSIETAHRLHKEALDLLPRVKVLAESTHAYSRVPARECVIVE